MDQARTLPDVQLKYVRKGDILEITATQTEPAFELPLRIAAGDTSETFMLDKTHATFRMRVPPVTPRFHRPRRHRPRYVPATLPP